MGSRQIGVVVLLTFLLGAGASGAAEVLLTDEQGQYPLGFSLEFLEDPQGRWSVEEVSRPPLSERFQPSRQLKPNFGYTRSAYWVRFALRDGRSTQEALLLELVSLVDRVELFTPAGQGFRSQAAGRWALPSQKEFKHRNTVFRLSLPSGEPRPLYLRFQSQGGMQLPLTVWTLSAFAAADHEEQLVNGLYFGIMLVMALYNAFLFLAVRDRSYLYYVLYIASFALVQLGMAGLAHEYVFPGAPWLSNNIPLFIGLSVLFAALFGRTFLETRRAARLLDRAFLVSAAAGTLVALLSFFVPYRHAVQASILAGMLTAVLLLVASVRRWLGGFPPARFFLLAFAGLVGGVLVIGLRNFNLLPIHFLTSHAMQVGSVLEVVLLSLALADRINQLRRDKEGAQRQALEVQERMARSFARFVPEQFLRFLGKPDITQVQLGDAVQREMTVLFSDLRSFTTISEQLGPRETFDFLNDYLRRIGPVVREHNGFIDKYIGDAVMALFPESPADAVAAAVAIRARLDGFNQERLARGLPPVATGFGIHTGPLMLGTIGEEQRLESTVIADAVNLASRLESLSKAYGATIVISEATLAGLGQRPFQHRFLDSVRVKGKGEPVGIFEILDGEPPEVRAYKARSQAELSAAILALTDQQLELAHRRFSELAAMSPEDKLPAIYLRRCESFLAQGLPPGGVWGAELEKG